MQKFSLLLDKFAKYLIAAFLIIVPLYPKFPFIRIPGSYVSIRFEDFLILLLGIYVFVKIIGRLNDVFKNKLFLAIGIFLFAGFASVVSGAFITKTISISTGFLHLARRIEYFIPLFAGYFAVRNSKNRANLIEFFVKCLLIVVFVSFVYGLGQRYLSWPVIITQNEEYSKGVALRWIPGSHINSTFAGHYDLATYLVMVLPILISLGFELKNKYQKILALGVVLGGLWLLSNTISRISIASYFVAVAVALLLLKKYREVVFAVVLSLIVFASSSSLLGRYLNLKNIFSFRVNSVYAQDESVMGVKFGSTPTPTPVPVIEDRSTAIRLNVEWPRAIRAFRKNPLVGTGYSSITLATDNDYLRALGESGALGFTAFMLVLGILLLSWIRALPAAGKFWGIESVFVAGVIGGFCGMLINALFIDVFEASKIAMTFWFLVGVAYFLVENNNNEQIN